jgi:hypothetical protein
MFDMNFCHATLEFSCIFFHFLKFFLPKDVTKVKLENAQGKARKLTKKFPIKMCFSVFTCFSSFLVSGLE